MNGTTIFRTGDNVATKENLFVRMDECIGQLHIRQGNLKCVHYSDVFRQLHRTLTH